MSTGAVAGGLSLGQQWEQNPNLQAPEAIRSTSKYGDPLGIFDAVTRVGGDPLNIYGHKNNPNALLFPSGAPNGVPGVLPNLGENTLLPLQPYGAFQVPKMGGGYFNGMAARAAGPLFNP